MKLWHPLKYSMTFISLISTLIVASAAAASVNSRFMIFGKSAKPEHSDKCFLLLERREATWSLPRSISSNIDLNNVSTMKDALARATFQTVSIDYESVFKFQTLDNSIILMADNLRSASPVLLENELSRQNHLNPGVHELRWVEYTPALFSTNPVRTRCLNLVEECGNCDIFLSKYTFDILSDPNVKMNLNNPIRNGKTALINVKAGVQPVVNRQDYIIATTKINGQIHWYLFDYKGKATLPMISNAKSTQSYHKKASKFFSLTRTVAGNHYTEISHLHFDSARNSYTSLIGHVYSVDSGFQIMTGGFWLPATSIIASCKNSKTPLLIPTRTTTEPLYLERSRVIPLLSNVSSHHKVNMPNGSRTSGMFLVRVVNERRYALFMSRDEAEGGWTVPGGRVDYADFKANYDPFLVGAVRELAEETYNSIELDLETVSKESRVISKTDNFGTIFRYYVYALPNLAAFTAQEMRKKTLTVTGLKEESGNMRWICLDDILHQAAGWNPSSKAPFVVKAETLSDDETSTYTSNYRLYHPGVDVLLQAEFPMAYNSALKQDTSFNCAYMKLPISVETKAYAGAVMLDSVARSIGFHKNPRAGIVSIPLTDELHKEKGQRAPSFKRAGNGLARQFFGFKNWNRFNSIHPILNHDNAIDSKNIVLVEKSTVDRMNSWAIEWVPLEKIAEHAALSEQDKAVFADPSCIATLEFWMAFYTGKVALPPQRTFF